MKTGLSAPTVPRTIWALGFVSMFADISSEISQALLPASGRTSEVVISRVTLACERTFEAESATVSPRSIVWHPQGVTNSVFQHS